MKTGKSQSHSEFPRQGPALPGDSRYLSPAPQAVPQAAGFSSGFPDAPQAVPQAAGLSDAPQAEPAQPARLESAMVLYLQFVFVEPVSRSAPLS